MPGKAQTAKERPFGTSYDQACSKVHTYPADAPIMWGKAARFLKPAGAVALGVSALRLAGRVMVRSADQSDFMPHGFCYLWNPQIVWLHVVSDGFIALAYCFIPLALIYLVRQRRDIPFNWIFWMFGLFIVSCGATHVMEIWTVWHASYLLAGVVKAVTAAASVATAVLLIPLIPKAIALPSTAQLEAVNRELKIQMTERKLALASLADHQSAVEELRIAQEALRESQGRLNAIIQSAMDAIITIDDQQRVLIFNAAAEKMFGYTPSEAVGSLVERFIPQRFLPAQGSHIRRFSETGTTSQDTGTMGAIWGLRANGEEFPLEASISQVETDGRRLFTVILRDISERKRAENALRESLAASKAALKELADQKFALDQHAIVAVTDVQGTITYVNDKFCAISKYSRDELLGQNHRILNSTHHPKEFFQQMYHTIASGKVWHGEIKNRAKDGSIYWVDTTIVPFVGGDGKPRQYVAIRADITERRQAGDVIRKFNDELEQRVVERTAQLEAANQELEAFTYSVSHDLRAPLRHIGGFSKMLLEEFGPQIPDGAQHYLQRIQEGTRRMGLLVDDLLNLARLGRHELRLQAVALNTVIEEVIRDLKQDCEGRQVEWKIGNLPFVECDPGLMQQVFQNLLSNALKFTRPRTVALIEVGQTTESGQNIVFVRDNGVGFSMKYVDKLFGVFQRLHRPEDFEGTGVGLATVQRIVHKHGGTVWAEAEIDKGAIFYFTLGASEPATLAAKATSTGGKI